MACVGFVGIWYGTTGDDTIKGRSSTEYIDGNEGDDVINAGGGDDTVCGGVENDKVRGGDANDYLIRDAFMCKTEGPPRPDMIKRGQRNDEICATHGCSLESDGFKDSVDFGLRNDSVWVNTSLDHDDVAANCEHVNAG